MQWVAPRRARPALVAAVGLVAALFLLPGTPIFSSSAPALTPKVGLESSLNASSSLPIALQYPFATRAGFDPNALSEVGSPSVYEGNTTVAVTFWPRSLTFFAPRTPGAPVLATSEVRALYGLNDSVEMSLVTYFQNEGLRVSSESPSGLSLVLQGPAQSVDAAFRTTLLSGVFHGRLVQFPQRPPTLPASFEAEVSSVVGLREGFSSFSLPYSPAALTPGLTESSLAAQALRANLVTPTIAHTIYGMDGLYNFSGGNHWSTGIGIVLLLWGWGYSPSDLQTFFSTYYPSSFPLPTINSYPIAGAPPPSGNAINDPSNAPRELTLDMEWAGSLAPGATLDAVYAPDGPSPDYSPSDSSMEMAMDFAVNQLRGVDVISMSFGTNDGGDMAFQAAYSTYFAEATAKGITLVAASGDDGGASAPGCRGVAATEFPASSPQVLAVGGTAPVLSYSPLGQFMGLSSEPAWNQSTGGFSSVYSAPAWQEVGSAAGPIGANGNRGIPDVAGAASYNFLYYASAPAAGAGTSFGSPLWAGIVAEMDAIRGLPFGFLTPRIYAVGAAQEAGTDAIGLADVTGSGNCVANASTGWDAVTGWGTPRGALLYEDLTGTFVDLPLTVSPASVAPGGGVNVVALVLNESTHQPIVGIPVLLTLSASGYSGPCGGTFDTANQTTNATGEVSGRLVIPGCYIGSQASVTATVSAGGLFGSNLTSVSVNLLGLAGFLAFLQQFPYNVIAFVFIILAAVGLGVWIGGRRKKRGTTPSVPPNVAGPGP